MIEGGKYEEVAEERVNKGTFSFAILRFCLLDINECYLIVFICLEMVEPRYDVKDTYCYLYRLKHRRWRDVY